MKERCRILFQPILRYFEKGTGPYGYRPTNRKILVALGTLFSFLALAVLVVAPKGQGVAFLLPVLVFGAAGMVSLVVGLLGSDRAVANIWGNK